MDELRRYLVAGAPMTVPGDWNLCVDAPIDDFNKVIFRTVVPIDGRASEHANVWSQ